MITFDYEEEGDQVNDYVIKKISTFHKRSANFGTILF